MSTAKRDIYWDIIKGVAIFLVVLGHSLQYFYIDSAYSNTDFLFNFIYSFHMPLFMVVSGYFAYSSFSKPIYEVFKKKFIQIMIPNVTWSLLTSILVYLNNPSKSFSFSLGYWYLNALWRCYVIFGIGNSLRLKCSWLVYPYILMVYAFGELLNISHLISMLPFFGIGLLIRKYTKFLENQYVLIFTVTFPLIILTSILYPSRQYNVYSYPFAHTWGGLLVYIVRFIVGTIGTFSMLSLIKIIIPTCPLKVKSFIAQIGMCTLGIYLIQRIVLEIIGARFAKLLYEHIYFDRTIITDVLFDLLIAPTISVFVILLCVYIIKLLRQDKYLRILFLGEQ